MFLMRFIIRSVFVSNEKSYFNNRNFLYLFLGFRWAEYLQRLLHTAHRLLEDDVPECEV